MATQPAQELRPGDGQQVIAGELTAADELIHQREAALDPAAIATATARLSSTTGGGCTPRQHPVQRGDLRPVGGGGRGRLRVRAAIAACSA